MSVAQPAESKHSVNGLQITVWEWPGEEPAVLLCHATGFHGRCWDQIVARLPGRRCIALDFRGHGGSAKPNPPYAWRRFGEDLAEITVQLGLRGAIAAGHSMGGHSVALAAALNPAAFSSLVLLDAVILPPDSYRGPQEPLAFVLRRRNSWTSADEMFDRFKDRMPFQTWDRAVLRDYCDFALNGSQLACPPEVEASIYASSGEPDANIYEEIAKVGTPVHIVRSRAPYTYGTFEGSPTSPDLGARFRNCRSDQHWDVSHFIPMEAPDLTAELILKLFNES